MEKYYKVNESELIDLLTSRVELETLNAGGVDSWVWYGAGFDEVYKEYGPNCKNFEDCKTELRQDCEHRIIVQWTDNKRRRVYERGLNNLDFETTSYDGAKSLVWKWRGLNESREN